MSVTSLVPPAVHPAGTRWQASRLGYWAGGGLALIVISAMRRSGQRTAEHERDMTVRLAAGRATAGPGVRAVSPTASEGDER